MKKWLLFTLLFFHVFYVGADGQFIYGSTGLMHLPTADMQRDKTVMAGASYLDMAATPGEWTYNTWNYYLNVTIFPWLEVGYVCTLLKMDVPQLDLPRKFRNQDSHFAVRLRLWKESWWKPWIPQVVMGTNDPGTSAHKDGYATGTSQTGNGYWNRYYIAASKHVKWKSATNIGLHAVYLYNRRTLCHYNGPGIGGNLRFALPDTSVCNRLLNGLNLMVEYDSRTVNLGGSYSVWKDRVNVVAELNRCKYPSVGAYFKIALK